MADAGWYPDPQLPGTMAYWDGAVWTGHRLPAAPGLPPAGSGRRRRRRVLLVPAAVVVLAAAGLTTWLAWPGPGSPTLTWSGARITDAKAVLSRAETQVAAAVTTRHGTSGSDTRCYFAKPRSEKGTDVETNLFCGPVLFVDGSASKEYQALPLIDDGTAAHPALKTAAPDASNDIVALPSAAVLERPDGRTPPSGNGGLHAPTPPRAPHDVDTIAAMSPGQHPKALRDARMIGRTTGLQITAAGWVTRYGVGDDARTAPAGERLLAMQLTALGGDLSPAGDPEPTLSVSGSTTARPLTLGEPGSWNVVAVPDGATATVRLPDSGLTQTLAVPSGTPGRNNLAVLARENRETGVQRTFTVPMRVSVSGGSASISAHAVATTAYLDYWEPAEPKAHASGPDRALLSVLLTYTDPAEPGKKFAFGTSLLHLVLPGGVHLQARNVSTRKGYLFNVFDVPASMTTATLQISGSWTEDGVTFTVTRAATIGLDFAAG